MYERLRQTAEDMRYRGRSGRLQAGLVCLILTLCLPMMSGKASAALYTDPYPAAPDKKGVALGADMEEDALELGIHHTTINFPISQFIAGKRERKKSRSYSYIYQGKRYWFRKANVNAWDRTLTKLKKNKVIVTGILLMQDRKDLRNLIWPAARGKKASFYAWNMDGGKAQAQIEAAISFLAKRYASGKHGRVVGWIVGNEIDSASEWNNAGVEDLDAYMDLYANMFETASRITRDVYSGARLYVPLDHFWNMKYSNDFTAKDCLDAFAVRMTRDGCPWNVAFHAYNGDLMQPSITDPQYFDTTDQPDTPIITMKNLGVLTSYICSRYGADKRVILSEHGYSSTWKGRELETDQARSVALSYYLAEADPMVDSYIYYSQVDQNELTKVGAGFGLWKVSKSEKATTKKQSWTIFKYMDTDLDNAVLSEASGMTQLMTGAPGKRGRTVMLTGLGKISAGSPALRYSRKWRAEGAVSSARKVRGGYTLRHDRSRNVNVYWGMSRSFGSVNTAAHPHLVFSMKGSRLSGVRGEVLVRVFSGSGHFLEASGKLSARSRRYCVDLGAWPWREAVSSVQILIKRKAGSWRNGASVTLTGMGFL